MSFLDKLYTAGRTLIQGTTYGFFVAAPLRTLADVLKISKIPIVSALLAGLTGGIAAATVQPRPAGEADPNKDRCFSDSTQKIMAVIIAAGIDIGVDYLVTRLDSALEFDQKNHWTKSVVYGAIGGGLGWLFSAAARASITACCAKTTQADPERQPINSSPTHSRK